MNNKINVVSVVGPTASGKTRLSVEIAKLFNGEVVSADSMQIYKGMDIATAKPDENEMQGVPHHLINFLDKGCVFSVGKYVELAREVIFDIYSRGKLPIVAGGTGLYVDSLLNDVSFSKCSSDPEVRQKYEKLLEDKGVYFLLEMLKGVDKKSYDRLSSEINPKRIIRALEFYETTGQPITNQLENTDKESSYNVLKIGLNCKDRNCLYERINRRVDIMVEKGLVQEAEEFYRTEIGETAAAAIGYKELLPYLQGREELSACLERLKMNSRRYAKRQITWFKRDNNINWLYIDEYRDFEDLLKDAAAIIKAKDF